MADDESPKVGAQGWLSIFHSLVATAAYIRRFYLCMQLASTDYDRQVHLNRSYQSNDGGVMLILGFM